MAAPLMLQAAPDLLLPVASASRVAPYGRGAPRSSARTHPTAATEDPCHAGGPPFLHLHCSPVLAKLLSTASLLVACQERLRGFAPSTTTAKFCSVRVRLHRVMRQALTTCTSTPSRPDRQVPQHQVPMTEERQVPLRKTSMYHYVRRHRIRQVQQRMGTTIGDPEQLRNENNYFDYRRGTSTSPTPHQTRTPPITHASKV